MTKETEEFFTGDYSGAVAAERNEFDSVAGDVLSEAYELLVSKGKEYAPTEDRFENFRRGADLTGKPMECVLWSWCNKHIISLQTMMDDWSRGVPQKDAQWEEKAGDILVYMILLKVMRRMK